MAVPQGIVGNDEAAWTQNADHHVVTLHIGTLVAIDEGHVELYAETRCFCHGVADDEGHLVGYGRLLYPRPRKVLHLVVDLERIEMSVVRQSLSHRDGRIAAERTHL